MTYFYLQERILGSLVDYQLQKSLISIPDGADRLGQGGYGDVWLGTLALGHSINGESGYAPKKEVAVKTLRQTSVRTKLERTLTACVRVASLSVLPTLRHMF